MNYHVLTPFSRWSNLIEIGDCLKRQGVTWHLLMVQGETLFPSLGDWVKTYYFEPPPEGFFIGHWLFNQFMENVKIEDEDRYILLTDDDLVEEGFFRKLDDFTEDVLVVSMHRSNLDSGGGAHCAYGTLFADPANMKVGHVGFEQILPKGKILKPYRCGSRYEADGDLIEKMWADHMEKFRFVPEAFVLFDRLPPGAWKCNRWHR